MLAIAAQVALYLALRHVSIATMPSWAHHRAAAPWPDRVQADIVRGNAPGAGDRTPPLAAPVLIEPAPVPLEPPDLGPGG